MHSSESKRKTKVKQVTNYQLSCNTLDHFVLLLIINVTRFILYFFHFINIRYFELEYDKISSKIIESTLYFYRNMLRKDLLCKRNKVINIDFLHALNTMSGKGIIDMNIFSVIDRTIQRTIVFFQCFPWVLAFRRTIKEINNNTF